MFRKIAIALVAASALAAPVMAQNTTLSGGSKATPAETTEKADKTPEKAEKSVESGEKAGKSVSKHHKVVRHHRHGTKAAKYGKSHTSMAMYGKHHGGKTGKFARYEKYESRRTGHGRTMGRHAYGSTKYSRSSKGMHTPSKSMSNPSND